MNPERLSDVEQFGEPVRMAGCEELHRIYKELPTEKPKPEILKLGEKPDEIVRRVASSYVDGEHFLSAEIIKFYNPSKKGNTIALRLEQNEFDSVTLFLTENEGKWVHNEKAPLLKNFQDPFFCEVGGQKIFGGVKTHTRENGTLGYQTVFYKYENDISEIKEDEPLFSGPLDMKDIRLSQLENGKIGVFTRPQGGEHGRGKIGYFEVNNLEELKNINVFNNQRIVAEFHGEGSEQEWGGVNDTIRLKDGRIGVLGHMACIGDDGLKHYYMTWGIFDPASKTMGQWEIIASAEETLDNHNLRPLRDDIGDAYFPGNMEAAPETGNLTIYTGLNDRHGSTVNVTNERLGNVIPSSA